MKVFEFHFNPGGNENLIFDSFCHEPENIYERKMGGIFMLGELRRALPHNFRLPEKIAAAAKKEFYSKFQRPPEGALKESLKKVNELLSAEVSKENTDWLGNLNFAIVSLKNFELHFTKVGGIKIFLIRGTQIIDIGQKLDSQEIEPYPLKIFNNIVSGKLGENDVLIAVTQELFPAVKQLVAEIAKIFPFDEKKLRDLLRAKEAEYSQLFGSFFLINIVKTPPAGKRPRIIFQKEAEKFSFSKKIGRLLKILPQAGAIMKKFKFNPLNFVKKKPKAEVPPIKPGLPPADISEIKVPEKPKAVRVQVKVEKQTEKPQKKKPAIPRFSFPKIKIPSLKIPNLGVLFNFFHKDSIFRTAMKRRGVLIPVFIVLLIAGYFLFRVQENKQTKERLAAFSAIEQKVTRAESLMILKDSDTGAAQNAALLLIAALEEIAPFTETPSEVKSSSISLKQKIEINLENLSGLVRIPDPIVASSNETKNMFLRENRPDTALFGGNYYVLDSLQGEIIKYSSNMDNPQLWLKVRSQVLGAKSIAVDGYVWVLSETDKILKFRAGQLLETIAPTIYPHAKNLSKIYAYDELPFLCIFDPEQKRIILMDKTGQVFQQFQSEKFDNLSDLAFSEDGKTLYVLNGETIYKINR